MPNKVSVEFVAMSILELRDKKILLDRDLAKLYGVSAKVLNQAVKRNTTRFPEDFMFRLSWDEVRLLRSQIVTLKNTRVKASKRGEHIKYLPYAFTEYGVAMLSSVLNSEKAIQVNILIMRAFGKLRGILLTHKELGIRVEELERKYAKHDETIKSIFQAIKQLLEPPPAKQKPQIGFHR